MNMEEVLWLLGKASNILMPLIKSMFMKVFIPWSTNGNTLMIWGLALKDFETWKTFKRCKKFIVITVDLLLDFPAQLNM